MSRWYETGEPLTDAIAKAEYDDGHQMSYDPTVGLSSVTRWTCTNALCGRSILRTPGGPVYGSATTEKCVDAS